MFKFIQCLIIMLYSSTALAVTIAPYRDMGRAPEVESMSFIHDRVGNVIILESVNAFKTKVCVDSSGRDARSSTGNCWKIKNYGDNKTRWMSIKEKDDVRDWINVPSSSIRYPYLDFCEVIHDPWQGSPASGQTCGTYQQTANYATEYGKTCPTIGKDNSALPAVGQTKSVELGDCPPTITHVSGQIPSTDDTKFNLTFQINDSFNPPNVNNQYMIRFYNYGGNHCRIDGYKIRSEVWYNTQPNTQLTIPFKTDSANFNLTKQCSITFYARDSIKVIYKTVSANFTKQGCPANFNLDTTTNQCIIQCRINEIPNASGKVCIPDTRCDTTGGKPNADGKTCDKCQYDRNQYNKNYFIFGIWEDKGYSNNTIIYHSKEYITCSYNQARRQGCPNGMSSSTYIVPMKKGYSIGAIKEPLYNRYNQRYGGYFEICKNYTP